MLFLGVFLRAKGLVDDETVRVLYLEWPTGISGAGSHCFYQPVGYRFLF